MVYKPVIIEFDSDVTQRTLTIIIGKDKIIIPHFLAGKESTWVTTINKRDQSLIIRRLLENLLFTFK